MKYIIMCGHPVEYGNSTKDLDCLRQLVAINGEIIVERTIRLLHEYGIDDISISSNEKGFENFGVPVLQHDNKQWPDAFYPTREPTCYIMGDVYFSPEAIQIIINTDTQDIEFFASAPPFDSRYIKKWAEPFAFKVQDTEYFRRCIEETKRLFREGKIKREISWELWQVIKGTRLNKVDYTNYTVINDYTCDVDCMENIRKFERLNNAST